MILSPFQQPSPRQNLLSELIQEARQRDDQRQLTLLCSQWVHRFGIETLPVQNEVDRASFVPEPVVEAESPEFQEEDPGLLVSASVPEVEIHEVQQSDSETERDDFELSFDESLSTEGTPSVEPEPDASTDLDQLLQEMLKDHETVHSLTPEPDVKVTASVSEAEMQENDRLDSEVDRNDFEVSFDESLLTEVTQSVEQEPDIKAETELIETELKTESNQSDDSESGSIDRFTSLLQNSLDKSIPVVAKIEEAVEERQLAQPPSPPKPVAAPPIRTPRSLRRWLPGGTEGFPKAS